VHSSLLQAKQQQQQPAPDGNLQGLATLAATEALQAGDASQAGSKQSLLSRAQEGWLGAHELLDLLQHPEQHGLEISASIGPPPPTGVQVGVQVAAKGEACLIRRQLSGSVCL